MPILKAAPILLVLATAALAAQEPGPLRSGDRTLAEWIAAMRNSMAEPSDRWRAG